MVIGESAFSTGFPTSSENGLNHHHNQNIWLNWGAKAFSVVSSAASLQTGNSSTLFTDEARALANERGLKRKSWLAIIPHLACDNLKRTRNSLMGADEPA
jgi:hypothetical protein